jgi:hypothetical protein
MEAKERTTKRLILHQVARVFDPLGFFSPVLIAGKIELQTLWKEKLGWDDPVPITMSNECNNTLQEINLCSTKEIRRWIINKELPISLLCFTDASPQAYATAVYIRQEDTTGQVRNNLIYAKARVAPIKPAHTLPRLELLAILIGVRSMEFVAKELDLDISHKILWSDSQIALHWVKSNKKQDVFVENRVAEIRDLGKNTTFKYVVTNENPADLATRGISFAQLEESNWFYGPEWIANPPQDWPSWNWEVRIVVPGLRKIW